MLLFSFLVPVDMGKCLFEVVENVNRGGNNDSIPSTDRLLPVFIKETSVDSVFSSPLLCEYREYADYTHNDIVDVEYLFDVLEKEGS